MQMGSRRRTMAKACFWYKIMLAGIVVGGFLSLLLMAATADRNGGARAALEPESEFGRRRRGKVGDHSELDLSSTMNKRRVPTGSDPIHNRRGNSGRPPGHAWPWP